MYWFSCFFSLNLQFYLSLDASLDLDTVFWAAMFLDPYIGFLEVKKLSSESNVWDGFYYPG